MTTASAAKFRAALWLSCLLVLAPSAEARNENLRIQPETEISWTPVAGNSYQLQRSPAGETGPWTDFGPAHAGIGTAQKAYDSAGGVRRLYRVMETVPASGETLISSNAIAGANPGFESGTNQWILGGTHSVVSSNARSGTSALRSHIPGGAVGAQLVKNVPAVAPGKAYSLSFWAKQISAGPSYVQHYKLEWVSSNNLVTIATGNWVDFSGGAGAWSNVATAPLVAPTNTASARIVFYFATGAVPGANGEVLLDDVALAYEAVGAPATPAQTREIPAEARPVVRLDWASINGVAYTLEENTTLDPGGWSAVAETTEGNGGSVMRRVAVEGGRKFFRLKRALLIPSAPPNIRVVATGISGSVSLAWDASASPGVSGYRVLYGTSAGNLDQTIDLGLVQSVTLPELAEGQTYHFTVLALSPDGAGPVGSTTVSAQPETEPAFQALFGPATVRQPDPVVDTPTARITYLADRARDRHAREGIGFLLSDGPAKAAAYKYDHYLSFYWEQRVAQIAIVDEVAKGGDKVVFNFTTQAAQNPAEFRTFFNVGSPLSGYHNNQSDYLNAGVTLVSTNASVRYPGETDFNYTATVRHKSPENRPLQVGDRMEVELSQFLLNPRHGRNNYYGTAFLYVVGQGVVPWYAKDWELAANKTVGSTSFDSFPLPEEAWLGGLTTLPYQYSNEPEHRFKQMAGNITPENGQHFMLGRRLHHTDFLSGAHSEAGNPVFAEQIGKVGPKFVAASCVACHVNNGRSLLPAVGATIDQAVVKVGSSSDGAVHPVLGEQLQPYAAGGAPEAGVVLGGYVETSGAYADGTPYTLRKPQLQFAGVTPSHHSLRVAPPLVGLGLLEAVPETAILANADPEDADGDGISGRPHYIADPADASALRLGRFTPKANQSTVLHQIAYAFNRDMGVASALFPVLDNETSPSPAEVGGEELDLVNRYVSLLGVGAQRDIHDPGVIRGKQLFASASCVKCHTQSFVTGPYHPMGELRNQTIRPYTDLLLHDMGPGLADNMGEDGASASEWRTAPLWNIGLSAGVSGGQGYLHDGRARTIEEAILWHGGEAEQAKENFRNMPAADRADIIRFIRSL